jgi:putative peptidoglycan lipid II flippase
MSGLRGKETMTGKTSSEAIFLRPWGGVAGAAMVVAVGFLGSRLLGLVRTMAIADAFGTTPDLDAYWVAFRLPDFIFQVLAGAAMGSAFIPTFARYVARRDEEQAWHLASSVLNLVAAITTVLAAAGVILAPWLVPLMAPGLEEGLQDKAVELTRIMLVSPVLFSISGMLTGILNARQHFFLVALAPMFYNLSIIFGAVFLSGPWGVEGLAAGVVLGSGLHLLVQVPGLFGVGMRYHLEARWRHPGVREVARLMLPRMAGLAAGQVNFVVAIFFASRLAEGSISALSYAWLLAMLPLALFGVSIATAAFPTMAHQVAADSLDGMQRTLYASFRYILFFVIPASVGLILLRDPLVSLLLERGKFDPTSASITSSALLYYSLGLFAHSSVEMLSRGFYALRDTRTPVAMALVSMALNLLFSIALVGPMEHNGLALAMSLATIVEASLLFVVLRGRLGGAETGLASFLPRALVATALMAGVVALFIAVEEAADPLGNRTMWEALVQVAGGVTLGGGTFFLAAFALRSEEARSFWRRLGLVR